MDSHFFLGVGFTDRIEPHTVGRRNFAQCGTFRRCTGVWHIRCCHQVSVRVKISTPHGRERARAHAAINMSRSFFENAIMGFVTTTQRADLTHNYVTSGRAPCLSACTLRSQWPSVRQRRVGVKKKKKRKADTAFGGGTAPLRLQTAANPPLRAYVYHHGHLEFMCTRVEVLADVLFDCMIA